jgi:DNA-binding phage protein
MGIEPWDVATISTAGSDPRLSGGVFEDGDPELIALALNHVARAKGLAHDAPTARSDIASLIGILKAMGLELTAKAA